MKLNQFFSTIASLALLLGACTSNRDQSASSSSPTASPSIASSPVSESPTPSPEMADHSTPSQGGQVVETGTYHLELVVLPEAGGTHLDFFLLSGDNHQAIEGATVTGQIQLPNGSQQKVDFAYDAQGKHYAAIWPEENPGEYKIVILTEINGEKVNGRFIFTR